MGKGKMMYLTATVTHMCDCCRKVPAVHIILKPVPQMLCGECSVAALLRYKKMTIVDQGDPLGEEVSPAESDTD